MNIFAAFEARIGEALETLTRAGTLPEGLDRARVVVEPPRDSSHGDLATNAALVLAKEARTNPKALAEALAADLRTDPRVTEASVAGPGFINLRLNPSIYGEVVRAALRDGDAYGRGATVPGGVNVEYVSANPTGPMHVGHGRGAVFGDALANLLVAAGRDVTREYYINDAGAQVDVLARSAFLRYREALGETVTIPEGLYPGDYLVPVGEALKAQYGDTLRDKPEAEWLPLVRDFAIDRMMDRIREDLAAIGIHHDVFFSERTLQAGGEGGAVAALIADLREKGLVYEGRLPPPKGQLPEDWEDREQTLFRATAFGDDIDRPLLKSDGSFTYFASDIAYHRSKVERGAVELIDVLGADHGGYVKRMQAAVKAVSDGKAALDVKLCQLVRLLRGGEPVKMSKRAGEFVTLREVIDEVGRDPVRFMMLYRKNDATLDFDLAKVVEQSKDNPVFYVQYAHARAASVFRQAREAFPDLDLSPAALARADLSGLTDSGELDMMRLIAQVPRVIEAAAAAHEPHRLAFHLYELASAFHSFWNKGKDLPQLRFVNQTDRKSTEARLALVAALKGVVASNLGILGVGAPDEMR
ncbi:arginyl-tRNA synthetase [Methylobacterium indicum]|uniref:arginine--tRNA ligase n=1 Tax=Methylobacterium indicum TaxID=1775910 RepID=UPI0007344D73|nr:arginine--tRNA ligase [Methylobacterium indicum]KTS26032.1 arginyl-tRNA synthetase [Methylobacterium indicum]KTS41121.1 arginyl-tRNA synthetase [Methylobacterium indicum]KTS42337.1 arginyl-tRNA synthetase [Methylobacterium indicum]